MTTQTRAHEVKPAIADVTVTEKGHVVVLLRLNIEAFVAGINLDGLKNTNDAPGSTEYDELRKLSPSELETAFRRYWPTMKSNIKIMSASGQADTKLLTVSIPEVGNTDLPRSSMITLSAITEPSVRIGWAKNYGNLIVRQQQVSRDEAFTGLLSGGELSPPINAKGGTSEGGWQTFVRYIGVGFDHIIPKGLDHILFVLGLFFLNPRFRPLLWQVTAFTLAHTVTLALGALGIVQVPGHIVEPLIAASIVYVAVENIFTSGLNPWRPLLIFGFGLLHGLGFASVLGEFGLPDDQFVPALIGFNVGVEVGQLAVIAGAFALVGIWFRSRDWYRQWISIPASLAIAAVGAYWVVERTLL